MRPVYGLDLLSRQQRLQAIAEQIKQIGAL